LAYIIQLESGNEGLQGKMAVGNVIVNRVRSPLFPSTIKDVILSPNQFPPAHGHDVNTYPVSAGSLEAARRVLNGERADGIGNAFYFSRAGAESWASQNRPFIITIGSHDFYG
jgi:N-acetylmuramoyl-L-alanine amidase